jgi:hypothetical protein
MVRNHRSCSPVDAAIPETTPVRSRLAEFFDKSPLFWKLFPEWLTIHPGHIYELGLHDQGASTRSA